jgi:hypothetical protein
VPEHPVDDLAVACVLSLLGDVGVDTETVRAIVTVRWHSPQQELPGSGCSLPADDRRALLAGAGAAVELLCPLVVSGNDHLVERFAEHRRPLVTEHSLESRVHLADNWVPVDHLCLHDSVLDAVEQFTEPFGNTASGDPLVGRFRFVP